MLSNPDLQASEFFNWNFTPRKVYDDLNQLESYYLMSEAGTMAIGWVHNLNAWTMNNFYLAKTVHNFLGCTTPSAQSLTLPGFAQDHDFYITYFPTRMNVSVPPNDTVVSTLAGEVTIDLSQDSLNGIASSYLDTVHSDYAFVIAPYPVQRSMIAHEELDIKSTSDWDFVMYPNPANDVLHILLPADERPKDLVLFDLSGKRVWQRWRIAERSFDIPLTTLAKGSYCVRVSDAVESKMKILVIN